MGANEEQAQRVLMDDLREGGFKGNYYSASANAETVLQIEDIYSRTMSFESNNPCIGPQIAAIDVTMAHTKTYDRATGELLYSMDHEFSRLFYLTKVPSETVNTPSELEVKAIES